VSTKLWADPILGDVYETSRLSQRAVVRLSDGTDESEWIWPGDPNSLLHQIAFYDEHCGDSYVSSEYEVTYRPSALTLLDDLIHLCGQVRSELDARAIAVGRTRQAVPAVPIGTAAAAFVDSLSAATTTAALEAACTVEDDASEQLGQLLQEEARLRSSDPAKERARLTTLSAGMMLLANHCDSLRKVLGPDAPQKLDDQRKLARELRAAAAVAASTTFDAEPVAGVGSNTWRTLWEAARAFSEQEAYHEHDFPVTGNDARCLLCHQELDAATADRLTRFQAAMQDQTQQLAATAERDLEALVQAISQIAPMGVRIAEELSTIPATDAAPARVWIEHAGALRDRLLEAIRVDLPIPDATPWPDHPSPTLRAQAEQASASALAVDDTQFTATLQAATTAKDELQGRLTVSQARPALAAEIGRLQIAQQIDVAKRATDTTGITRKSTELARAHVTDVVRDRFTRECDRLKLERVTLSDVGGKKGQLRHRSSLLNAARDASVQQVLSEGEQTALGLAGFLTEAYFDGSKSALVFDDPVTSLDHVRRWEVACRLAEFAKDRQVIVFTHDVSFVGDLSRAAKRQQVTLTERAIERTGDDHPGKTADQQSPPHCSTGSCTGQSCSPSTVIPTGYANTTPATKPSAPPPQAPANHYTDNATKVGTFDKRHQFGQPVVALGSGVGVPGGDARFDRRPPGLDGGGQAVCFGRVGRSRMLVEAVQPSPDDVAPGGGPGQGEQRPQVFFDRVRLQDLHPGITGVDQRVPHPRKGFRAQPLMGGQQPAPRVPGPGRSCDHGGPRSHG